MAETKHLWTFKLVSAPAEGQSGVVLDQTCPTSNKPVQCVEMQSSLKMKKRLPKGLVGSRCTTKVTVAGQTCPYLLDTGSQVTTIPVSFYNKHLSDQPIHSLTELLHIEGAAGQSVPYLGYVEIAVTFPEDFLGSKFAIQTLALVPDIKPGFPTSVLIGMNTLEALYERFSTFQPSSHGYQMVLKALQLTHQSNFEDHIGLVTLCSRTPVLISAGRTVVVEGLVKVSAPTTSQSAIIQHPDSGLPVGLCVSSCLVAIPISFHSSHKVPVVVTNESEQDVFIPPFSVIADLDTYERILSDHHVVSKPSQSPTTYLSFNFGESSVPPEWQE